MRYILYNMVVDLNFWIWNGHSSRISKLLLCELWKNREVSGNFSGVDHTQSTERLQMTMGKKRLACMCGVTALTIDHWIRKLCILFCNHSSSESELELLELELEDCV